MCVQIQHMETHILVVLSVDPLVPNVLLKFFCLSHFLPHVIQGGVHRAKGSSRPFYDVCV